MSSKSSTTGRTVRRGRALVAAILAAALTVVGIQSAAFAAVTVDGVTLTINYGDAVHDGTTVVEPGTSYIAKLDYVVGELEGGAVVKVTVPEGVKIPADGLEDLSGNDAVESFELDDDGNIVLTFKDPLPTNVLQGEVLFEFEFNQPDEGTGFQEVTWSLGDEPHSTTLIVREPGDELRPDLDDSESKSVGGHNLWSYVTDNNGSVVLNGAVADEPIHYTLRIVSAEERSGVEIVDVISEYLEHRNGSVTAKLIEWDEDGFNRTETDFDLDDVTVSDDTLTISGLDLPANSILEIQYDAYVRENRIGDLVIALQDEADLVDPEDGGDYFVTLSNTANIDGTTASQSTSVGGSIERAPRPELWRAFDKTVAPSEDIVIALNDEGDLADPIEVTYTFTVDLTEFADYDETAWELDRNVVITDTLPAGVAWGNGTFITATDNVTGLTHDLATPTFTCQVADSFDENVCRDQYRVTGQLLEINVGRDTATEITIEATATINSLQAAVVHDEPNRDLTYQTLYVLWNNASFAYSEDQGQHRATADSNLALPKEPGSVINDPSRFDKTTESPISVQPGESVDVPYTFTVAAGAVPDLRSTRLIDVVDTTVFDVSDLDVIQDSITGRYDNQGSLSGSDFDLELTVDDELIFTLSETFGSDLPEWMDLTGALTGRLEMAFSLPTHVIQGKQTLQVSNNARVEGDDAESYVWVSAASGSATSYGRELEVSKLLYAGEDSWSRNLRVEIDDDGELVVNEFVYRIELIPHGGFSSALIPLADTLPEGLQFEGFVNDGDIDAGTPDPSTTVYMGGNIDAEWVEEENTIHITQRSGTSVNPAETIAVNFLVSVTDFTEDVGITNSISGTSATITPSNGYPLMVLKQDSERPDVSITDRDARFTVTGPNSEVITDAAYVVDGQLMVEGEDGADSGIVVPADPASPDEAPAGQYTVTETVAPAGYALTTESVIATIGTDGSSNPVTLFNDPLPLYAIGDYVWIDMDNDGQQGTNEPPLPGVTVELLDPTTGEILAVTETDLNGRYVFDLLPVGDYQVRFTLTEEQAATYTFTEPLRGDDTSQDSDAERATGQSGIISLGPDNEQVIDGSRYEHRDVQAFMGIDPTWDAGVVLRPGTVAVGDYVWVDVNRDGRQDDGEPGIPGVTLVLTGPDGGAVIDVDGREVQPQVTDHNGRYLFPDLPVLEEGQSYTVTIDRGASAEALAPYLPTTPGVGDREGDSANWTASSQGLTEAGQEDLTLDFGFVLIPEDPDEGGVVDEQDEGLLSRTGAEVGALVAASALLLLLGAAFVMWRRRLNA